MTSFIKKIKGAFTSPSPTRKSKSTGNLNYLSQVYVVKEKEIPKIHYHAWRGDLDKVIELCRPDKLNSIDKEGRTPLLLAVAGNHCDVVEHLLREDAKLQILDRDSRTPLVIASLVGNPRLMEILLQYLDQKKLVNLPDKNGLNPLFYAIKNQNLPVLSVLINCKEVDLDYQDKDKNTALHYCVIQRKLEAIDMLIENGADLDMKNADGRTPLMLAAQAGDEETTDYLLDYGADKTLKDNSGKTAMDLAELSRNQTCVNLFKQARPVKPNASKMAKLKRHPSANLESSTLSSDANKKFENIFSGQPGPSNGAVASLASLVGSKNKQNSQSSKFKQTEADAESNTSKINDDDRVLSHNKSDKLDSWGNSDNDQDDDEDEEEDSIDNNQKKKTLKFDSIFGGSSKTNDKVNDQDLEIEIDDNFGTSKEMPGSKNHHVLDSLGSLSLLKNSSNTNWSIYVYTSNVKGAGTDANVYVQIYGSKASSAQFNLEAKGSNPFEAGKCDKFDKDLPEIGRPVKVKIGHDNKGGFAGWHLDKVVLQNNITNEKFTFPCNRWLAKDELDHKIELELFPDNSQISNNNNKLVRDLSSSSWNSTDEDDSYGIKGGIKSMAQGQAKPVTNLKQIDELNETFVSRNSKNSNNKNQANNSASNLANIMKESLNSTKKSNINKSPEISDFDDSSFDEPPKLASTNKSATSVPKDNEGALSFLMKSTLNKSTKSNDQQPNGNKESVLSFLAQTNSTPKKQILDDFDDDFSISSGPHFKKNETIGKLASSNLNNKARKSVEYSDDEKSQSIGELLNQFDQISSNKKPTNNNQTIGKLLNKQDKPPEISDADSPVLSLKEMMRKEFKPNEPGVQGIRDILKNDILSNQSSHSKFSNNSQLSPELNNKGVKDAEKKSIKSEQASVLGLRDLMKQDLAKQQKNVDRSESVDDLEDEFNKIIDSSFSSKKNKSTNLLNEFDSSLKFLTEPPPPSFRDENTNHNLITNDSFILHGPDNSNHHNNSTNDLSERLRNELPPAFNNPNSPPNGFANKNQTIGKMFNTDSLEKKYDRNSVDSLTMSNEESKKSIEATIRNKNNQSKIEYNPNSTIKSLVKTMSINKSLNESDDDFDDEIESLAAPPQTIKQNTRAPNGTISGVIGAAILNSPTDNRSFKTSQNNGFANILPELFDSAPMQRSRVDEIDNAHLNKLIIKNEELEKAKLELENQLRESEKNRINFEKAFNNTDKRLAETERLLKNLEAETNSKNTSDINQLKKEIANLKEEKKVLEKELTNLQIKQAAVAAVTKVSSNNNSLRSSEDLTTPLMNQNESLTIKVKALESQIEELNKDREILSACKIDLALKLDEAENDIKKRNDALSLVTLKYNMEKKNLTDENSKAKKDLNDLNEMKIKLKAEIDELRASLSEKNLDYERLNIEKVNFERQLNNRKEDVDRLKRNYESELDLLKEQQTKLTEKLRNTEERLVSTEKEAKYTKEQIDDRQKQIDDLKNQLSKSKQEYNQQLNLYKKEKEEKENLLKKCEQLENSIRKNMNEIAELKMNQFNQELDSHSVTVKSVKANNMMTDQDDRSISSATTSINQQKIATIEKENKRLQNEVKNLNDKLSKTESELEKYKTQINLKSNSSTNVTEDSKSKRSPTKSPKLTDNQNESYDNASLKSEVQKLRDEFNVILNKYSTLESSNQELANGLFSLRNTANSAMNQSQNSNNLNRGESFTRRDPVDVAGLVTDVPLKTLAVLNNLLIKNIIASELQSENNLDQSQSKQSVNFNKSALSDQPNFITNQSPIKDYSSYFPSSYQYPYLSDSSSYPSRYTNYDGKVYSDLLKYELSKRIELQVAKELPLSNLGELSSHKLASNDLMFNHSTSNLYDSNNYDSIYNAMTSLNSRYSTVNNIDLLNNLRSKFLI